MCEVVTRGDRLGAFILVVRELKVKATDVQIKAVAEKCEGHDDALGVPARSALTEGSGPAGLAGFGELP
jgi:hypothetical protein